MASAEPVLSKLEQPAGALLQETSSTSRLAFKVDAILLSTTWQNWNADRQIACLSKCGCSDEQD